MANYKKYIKNIRKEFKEYLVKHKIQSVILGISGGADSTLIAMLARPVCDELKIPLIGRSIPISSNKDEEISRANDIGEYFCTDFQEIDLTDLFHETTFQMGTVDYLAKTTEEKIRRGNMIDLVYNLEEDVWNGKRNVSLKVIDIK